ncbi:hypothetical protein HID58_080378 [Brassica napus]|uniref:BnaC08g48000D protein n=3 Tax=Brassica TaxID=3705 RepID=A0A078IN64_BRANA|nr:uncharacterized protein BNAC08G48000D [Brassica napus]KAH0863167.1 hypothetical protein HID58_080378 [Brassica napus]CDY50854.1 BnaC08g48000D [Brassica napus]VDD55147.1 unnamed protein product [Brassica oleracea]
MEEAAAAAELESLQIDILRRISALESSILPESSSPSLPEDESQTVSRLSAILRSGGVKDFSFKRVAPDYYDWPLESRRDVLGASSVDHLGKSIVLVNTQASSNVLDCSDRNNSKYYVVVVQYTARFNADAVKNFLYTLNEGKIPKKRFNLRLAPEETSIELTGFEHNAVTCVGMKTSIPVILDEAIAKLKPDFFWLGGGEIDLKLGVRTSEFLDFVKPFVVPCS